MMAGRPWERWEDALLAKYLRPPIPGLDRTPAAIKVRRLKLGILLSPRIGPEPWEPWEDALLRSGERVPAGLEHRGGNAIKIRRRRLGIPQPRHPYRLWTPGEDALVREAMTRPRGEHRYRVLAAKLGRSPGAVRMRATTLRRRGGLASREVCRCMRQSISFSDA